MGGHAWVVFERDGERWLFETVATEKERMIAPLDESRAGSRPEVAVNGNLETRFYTGYAHTVLERLDRERAERRERLGRMVRRAWPGERMKAWAFWTD